MFFDSVVTIFKNENLDLEWQAPHMQELMSAVLLRCQLVVL